MKTISKPSAAVKTGILLINLGTPDATDYWSMRRYLKQFLSDKRVVQARGPVWWLVLNGLILTRRPRKSGRAYDLIWNHQAGESPLRSHTRAQAEKLANAFAPRPGIHVEWAMRYGTPSIATGIDRLSAQGCGRILLFPLYPQYCSATTGTAMDSAFGALMTQCHQPAIRSVPAYFDHPHYIRALADSIRAHHATLPWQPAVTLASFHGLPASFIAKGDPYQAQCEASTALLRTEMRLNQQQMPLAYQSRSGRKIWIMPETEQTVQQLAESGVKNLSLVAPGFAADGLETLEELGIRAFDIFRKAGGENITLVPCLNASTASISLLEALAQENLGGWS